MPGTRGMAKQIVRNNEMYEKMLFANHYNMHYMQ